MRTLVFTFAVCLLLLMSVPAIGQVRHNRVRSDMPPGLAAERYRMADPSLSVVTQPVRIVAPPETTLSVISNGAELASMGSKVTMGLAIGPVYRVKVSGLRLNEQVTLYPSIEVLGRLYPPKGLENRFPIEIEITRDDLLQVIDGHMVTKVIYLEDGEMVVPHRHTADHQPTFDVSAAEDPLHASQSLGRPMAILRIGSRVPVAGEAEGIQTLGPPPVLLPEPASYSFSDQPNAASPATGQARQTSYQEPAGVPPIVPGYKSSTQRGR